MGRVPGDNGAGQRPRPHSIIACSIKNTVGPDAPNHEFADVHVQVATTYAPLLTLDASKFAHGFHVPSVDKLRELVIDPAYLDYCGIIGGSGTDSNAGIAVDGSGNAHITGYTTSTESIFPETSGASEEWRILL